MTVFLGAITVYQVYMLIRLVESSNREMMDFLNSIKYDDFSQSYQFKRNGSGFDELREEFNTVLSQFKELRTKKESEYLYLKNIIHHIGIGIFSFDQKGNIQLINTAAKRLLNVSRLRSISELEQYSEELHQRLKEMRTGQKELISVYHRGEQVQLSVYTIELLLRGTVYKLVTIQNIQSELDEQELDAWQNLIRVLTHEIMNSVTPISSLSNTMEEELSYLKQEAMDGRPPSMEDLEDVHLAVSTIRKRSDGMTRFVNEFRSLTHVPLPDFKSVSIQELFKQLETLMLQECESRGVKLSMKVEPDTLKITADEEQIIQVLLNLVKNAMQAFDAKEQTDKQITLYGQLGENDHPVIRVVDNGPGIDQEAQKRIFIPFFTTKKGGSGIGLSLSRQILRQHKGTLTVVSTSGEGATFILKF
ncbi:sensor histidine kinase [Algivirga pacifica]|uniref:histidine kinase n=2 Tax=Algivirga pacifica TaxID=1162670 RepID=A0ABP9DMX5_9BACT